MSSLEIRSDDSDSDASDEENDTNELFTRTDETWIRDIQAVETAMNSIEPTDQEQNSPPTTISDSQSMSNQVADALRLLATKIDNSVKAQQTQADAKLTAELQNANEQVQGMITENTQIKEENQKLLTRIELLTVELTTMKTQLETQSQLLEERGNSLAIERSLRTQPEAQIATEETKHALIIGSSLLRDFDETLYNNTKVVALSGAKPTEVTNDLKARTNERYSKVTVLAGGNQVGSDIEKVDETIMAMKDTINAAKELAPSVAICELPPRINTQEAIASIKALNTKLKDLADECECEFIEVNSVFTLANGEPNDGYFIHDGIHLTLRGATKLVEQMGIPLKDTTSKKVNKWAAYNSSNTTAPPAGQPRQVPPPMAVHASQQSQPLTQTGQPGQRLYAQAVYADQNTQPPALFTQATTTVPYPPTTAPAVQVTAPAQVPRYQNRIRNGPQPSPNRGPTARKSPPDASQRPAQSLHIHPRELSNQQQTQLRRGPTHPAKPRPQPLCEEKGFCGYCGEVGHRYLECRHGSPVSCNTCHQPTHKAKFCHMYPKKH